MRTLNVLGGVIASVAAAIVSLQSDWQMATFFVACAVGCNIIVLRIDTGSLK